MNQFDYDEELGMQVVNYIHNAQSEIFKDSLSG